MADSPNTPNPSAIPQSPSRRSIIAAGAATIGATAVAGGPVLASAVAGDDPIFAALAELERVNARVKTVGNAHDYAEELFLDLEPRTDFISLSDGLSVAPDQLDHEGIDKHFADPGMPEQNIRAAVKKLLSYRKKPLTPELQAEREAKRQAAHAALDRYLLATEEAEKRSGLDEAQRQWNAVLGEQTDAERKILETRPRTKAGALALLRFAVDSDLDGNDMAAAIRNAVAVLDRGALS
jgi:hypothetical protein